MAGNTLALRVDVDAKNVGALDNIGSKLASGTVQIAKFAAGATAAVGAFGYFAAGFASDLNESLSKVGIVFGDNADEIEAWSQTAAESMGMSQQQALEAAGTFGNLFSAMDIGAKPTQDMSQGLVQLASDLGSFNNMDPTEVLEKLRAGVSGEAEPLRALGINISQARTEAKALELGLWDGIGAISASAKAQANYALIMEDSTLAQGDFARTSDGMANQQRTLAATFQDTMADVGQAFVPIVEMILPAVTAGFALFGAWITANMPTIQAVLATVAGAIGAAFTFLVTEVFPRVIGAIQAVVGWVVENMPTFQAIFETVSAAIALAFTFLVDEVFPRVAAVLGGVFTVLTETVFPALAAAATFVMDNWKQFEPFVLGLAIVLGGVLVGAFVAWGVAAAAAGLATIVALAPILLPIAAIALAVGGFIWVWNNFKDKIIAFLGQVWDKVKTVFDAIGTIIGWVVNNVVKPALDGLGKAFSWVFENVIEPVLDTFTTIFEAVGDAIGDIVDTAEGVFEGLGRVVKTVWDGISAGIKFAVNGIIRIINGIISGINAIQVHIDVAGVKVDWNGLNLGYIPYLAHGGIVTGPTLAMIGEAGPEAVVPLDRYNNGRAAPTIIINTGVGDPVAIGREVVEALQAYERHNGIGWRAAT